MNYKIVAACAGTAGIGMTILFFYMPTLFIIVCLAMIAVLVWKY